MVSDLTQQDVDRYHRDGYVAPVRALDEDRAGALNAGYEAFLADGAAEAGAVLRSKPHLVAPALYDLVCDPLITGPVSGILGPDLLVWGSSFFAKPAGDPGLCQLASGRQLLGTGAALMS